MRIATWNVNSIRQRLDHLLTWLKDCTPDIACLQEIKCVDEAFPREAIEALGYNVVTHGQKTFNGVALLSKLPFEETTPRLGGDDEDVHARFLEGVVTLKHGAVRMACLYLPNGNPPETEKYPYKLKWMSRLLEYSKQRLKTEEPLVLAGDFNVIPAARDVHNPAAWVNDALFRPATRESFQSLLGLAAHKGQHQAQAMLGQMLFNGDQLPRQAARGLMWLTLARDSAAADEVWIKESYNKAIAKASEDDRAMALQMLEHWVQGRKD